MAVSKAIATQGEDCVAAIRRLASECLPAGHRAANVAWSLAPLGAALYGRILKHNPANPLWFNRDRLVLSWGEASFWQYCLLHLCGYGLDIDDLRQFGQWRSLTPVNPEHLLTPGVEASTGPVGEGLANAVGMAFVEMSMSLHFNRPEQQIVDHFTYVLCSEEDLKSYAATGALSQAALGFGKLICIGCIVDSVDINPEGWHVLRAVNNVQAITAALELSRKEPRPSLILIQNLFANVANSEPPPGQSGTRSQSWERIQKLGAAAEQAWNDLLETYGQAEPALSERFQTLLDGTPPPELDADLARWALNSKSVQDLCRTVLSSGVAFHRTFSAIGGICQCGVIDSGVHVRSMAGIANGYALHGSLNSTFSTSLSNIDSMHTSVRLAAQMKLPVTYILTHDEMGEGGPSVTPVEQLAGLRAIPHFYTFRPADVTEALAAWRFALHHRGPVGIISISQVLPNLGPVGENARHGGYVLKEASVAIPKVLLISSGPELHICLQACEILEFDGTPARVVSLPCWELFYEQSREYRDSVLIPGVPRLGVEVGSSLGWERWTGEKGDTLCLEGFGVSAPREVNLEKFGFTPENVAAKAKRLGE